MKAEIESLDPVKLRDVFEDLASRGQNGPMLELVMHFIMQCKDVIDGLSLEIALLQKQLFGRKSEKVSKDQLTLFTQVLEAVAAKANLPEGEDPPTPPPKKKRVTSGRRPLVPTRTEKIPVPEEDRPCPACGGERCSIEPLRSLVVEYTPPKIEVIEYLREKLACRPCDGEFSVAPQPKERVVESALPGPTMLSALAVNKVVDGLPLHRTRRIFARSGLDIPVQTLNRWEGFGHNLLVPVIDLLKQQVLDSDTINLDDTGLRVRDRSVDHGVRHGHVWVFVGRKFDPGGDLTRTIESVFYLYAPTWEAKHPEAFLRGCSASLQGDAYRGYERIAAPTEGDPLPNLLAGCMMHARRPFIQAFEAKDPNAPFFVDRFQALYRVESKAKEEKLTVNARLELRQRASLPILEQLRERALDLQNLTLTKLIRNGTRYLLNQWDKLLVPFVRDGRLEIDNGSAERRLRRVASGRKSWLFAGSEGGAVRFAGMLSLVSSAEAVDADPGTYLADVTDKIANGWPNRRCHELLPHIWRLQQAT